mmetsp:Transcript_29337/g.62398  ORF Transcript_29337/g.62398 Transcript_29337/m.62398 type:complete len:237 (+) Transcript_29337:1278-1988(+)
MTGQPDHSHIVHKVLAPVLGSDPQALCHVRELLLPLQVAEAAPTFAARCGQAVKVLAAGQLHRLHAHLGREATNHQSKVVGRTGCRAQVFDLLKNELREGLLVERALGLLQELRLVGAAPALADVEKVVGATGLAHHIDLCGQVGLGVCLLEHRQRRHLGVSQVALGVGLVDAVRDVSLIVAVSQHEATTLGHYSRRAGVLARGHHLPCRNTRVLQELQSYEAIVARCLRVLEDLG